MERNGVVWIFCADFVEPFYIDPERLTLVPLPMHNPEPLRLLTDTIWVRGSGESEYVVGKIHVDPESNQVFYMGKCGPSSFQLCKIE